MARDAEIQEASVAGTSRIRDAVDVETAVAPRVAEPADARELGALVRECEREHRALVPIGAARTAALMRRRPAALAVSLARMNRIVACEPGDLTVVVEAGITIGALNQSLAARGLRLPCDPPAPDSVTVGALIGAANAGPLRLSAGTVRDLLIGVGFVGHDGREIHAGGRVVKNVAGYDLMKVMTGSFGTLGIVTQAAFKVFPVERNYRIALASRPSSREAFAAAARLHDALPLTHLEVLSGAAASDLCAGAPAAIAAGFTGNRADLDYQAEKIRTELGADLDLREGAAAVQAYERLRDFELPGATLAALVATPPAELARCVERCGGAARAHAGCGVAQIFSDEPAAADQACATLARWREAARAAGGHARVLRCRLDWRERLDIFDQPDAAALRLMRRLKSAFDPAGIFNPGAFVASI